MVGTDPDPGVRARPPDEALDLLTYGEPAALPFDAAAPDRRFDYEIDRRPGFLDGRPGMWWTVNGDLFPDVPMYMVVRGRRRGLRDRPTTAATRTRCTSTATTRWCCSRDGEPATGSPWWVDSLEVGVGETYEVAFLADNPGLWMDHCHNLPHAAEGLVAHLMYDGVTSSFRVGGEARQPA